MVSDEDLRKALPWELYVRISENRFQKPLTEEEKAQEQMELKKALEPLRQQGKRTDLLEGLNTNATSDKYLSKEGNDHDEEHRILSIIAKFYGESRETVRARLKVFSELEQQPEKFKYLKEDIQKNRKSIFEANKIIQKLKYRETMVLEAAKVQLPSNAQLICKNLSALTDDDIPPATVDLLFCDPPYSLDWVRNYSDVGRLGNRTLKMGASLVCYCNQEAIPEIIQRMESEGLKFWWQIAVIHEGPSIPIHAKQVFSRWKPLLWFLKGEKLVTPS